MTEVLRGLPLFHKNLVHEKELYAVQDRYSYFKYNIRNAQLTIVDGNIGDHKLQTLHINSPVESRNETSSRCEMNELDRIAFRDKSHAMQATEWTNPDDLCNEIIRAFTTSQSKKLEKKIDSRSTVLFGLIRAADDSKKLWKSLNDIVSGSSKKDSLTIENVKISDAKQIGQELNHFFTSIGHQVDHSPPPEGYEPPRPHSESDIFYWKPTTPNEVREIIRALKPNKSPVNLSTRLNSKPSAKVVPFFKS
ncbi:hypothetical protein HHI36_020503 [Cryptolaemus montrouzieri]|uniref:Uncharacterized protein n=1 Tax=Cryptolaemus montrouzieri TaxID=559131 RepID=A0ABD2NAG2_9CUCU